MLNVKRYLVPSIISILKNKILLFHGEKCSQPCNIHSGHLIGLVLFIWRVSLTVIVTELHGAKYLLLVIIAVTIALYSPIGSIKFTVIQCTIVRILPPHLCQTVIVRCRKKGSGSPGAYQGVWVELGSWLSLKVCVLEDHQNHWFPN